MKSVVTRAILAAVLLAATVSVPRAQTPLRLTGVNVAGAEFASKTLPGKAGTDYFYPTSKTIDHFAAKGMNAVRIPFLWERMQPTLGADLNTAELDRLATVVSQATSRGMTVILDVHNYAAYRRQPIGSASVPPDALADLWLRLAGRFKDNKQVVFGLMNEPKGLPTETWLAAANAAIASIRQTGAKNLILVPGNGWTGAHSWFGKSYGTPNAEAMLGVVDPANNYAFDAHQYLDSNYSGTHPQCQNEQIGVTTLRRFTQWLRDHRKRGFLGEFGAGSDPVCMAALDAMLADMEKNSDVWLGWTYWAAGFWPPTYFTSVQPIDGADRPQMSVLLKHVNGRATPE
jgi:endoglucanase